MTAARWYFLVGMVTCLAEYQPISTSPSTMHRSNSPDSPNLPRRESSDTHLATHYDGTGMNGRVALGGGFMACDGFAMEKNSQRGRLAASRSMVSLSPGGGGHDVLESRSSPIRSMSTQNLALDGASPLRVPSSEQLELRTDVRHSSRGLSAGALTRRDRESGEGVLSEPQEAAERSGGEEEQEQGGWGAAGGADGRTASRGGEGRTASRGGSVRSGDAERKMLIDEDGAMAEGREEARNMTGSVVGTEDLVASVWQFCNAGNVEEALELVQTDMRNISQPACADILLAFAEAGRSDCAQAALLHMQMLCVEVGAVLDTSTYNALMLAYARDSATAAEDGLDQSMGVLDLMDKAGVDKDITTFNRYPPRGLPSQQPPEVPHRLPPHPAAPYPAAPAPPPRARVLPPDPELSTPRARCALRSSLSVA